MLKFETELIMDNKAIEFIKNSIAKDLLVTEDVDHGTFQILATARAIHKWISQRQVTPQFEIEFTEDRKSNSKTEL